MTLVCEYFRDVRKKYIKPFYYQRPNMMKFLDIMTSVSKKDRFRLMLFLKVVFKMYAETLRRIIITPILLISLVLAMYYLSVLSITIINLFLKKQYLLLNITIYF